jgi:spore germination protein GerM
MNRERARWILVAFGAAVAVALLVWGLTVALKRESSGGGRFPENADGSRTIDLYFPGREGGMATETREILGGETLEDDVRRTVEELIRGPSEEGVRPLPSTTRLLSVFWDGDGEIALNFSDDLRTDHPGGSEAELATVRCLIRTVAANFAAVERVRLLVDGDPVATLAGHVDLSRALNVEDHR